MAIVIVQHLDPEHQSSVAAIISSHTKLQVHVAEDGMEVETDHVSAFRRIPS